MRVSDVNVEYKVGSEDGLTFAYFLHNLFQTLRYIHFPPLVVLYGDVNKYYVIVVS